MSMGTLKLMDELTVSCFYNTEYIFEFDCTCAIMGVARSFGPSLKICEATSLHLAKIFVFFIFLYDLYFIYDFIFLYLYFMYDLYFSIFLMFPTTIILFINNFL